MPKFLILAQISAFSRSCWRFCLWTALRASEDSCLLKAASLTYYSLLSVVPVLAVFFGIAKGFGFEAGLQQTLLNEFKDQKEIVERLIQFGYTMLEETQGGLVAGIGVVVLLFTAIGLFSSIENCLNTMWGAEQGRSSFRKISDYLALILICPIFFTLSSSMTVYVTSQIKEATESNMLILHISPALFATLKCLPYILSSFLFGFLYTAMPNAKVKLSSAAFAGIIAGICYQVLQSFYIASQIAVTKVSAIYGSFAALPLFLTWLYFSWVIFLIGAEILVLHQEKLWKVAPFSEANRISPFEKKLAYIAIVRICVSAFLEGKPLVTLTELSYRLNLPIRVLVKLSQRLVQSKILCKAESQKEWTGALSLARDPYLLHMSDVINAIEGLPQADRCLKYPGLTLLSKPLQQLQQRLNELPENLLIKDLDF